MKIIQKIAALAGLLIISVSASAETYIRPELIYSSAKFDDTTFSKDIGFGVTGGTTLGTQDEHDLSLSVSLTTFSKDYSGVYNGTTNRSTAKVKHMPLMFNYRYLFLEKVSPVRPYLGASFGVVSVKYTTEGVASNPAAPASMVWNNSASSLSFNYGVTAGLVWAINDKFALDLGYRYSTSEVTLNNWKPTLTTGAAVLGARFKF